MPDRPQPPQGYSLAAFGPADESDDFDEPFDPRDARNLLEPGPLHPATPATARPARPQSGTLTNRRTPTLPHLEDDQAEAPVAPTRRRATVPRRRAWTVGLALIVAAVLAVAAAVAALATDSSDEEPRQPLSRPTLSTSMNPADGESAGETCPDRRDDGPVTTGRGPGDQNSGPGVILAWNFAYYELRSADKARAVTAPNAVAQANIIQDYIDELDADLQHCVTITRIAPNRYRVLLTIAPPSSGQSGIGAEERPQVIRQIIQTAESGGKTWITLIGKDN